MSAFEGLPAPQRRNQRIEIKTAAHGSIATGLAALIVGWLGTGCGAPALASGTFYVDGANPACSNAGPGTQAVPYCTMTSAATARGGPGTTLFVKPAIYREQVTVPASGAAGAPFIIQAIGPGAIVDGADNYSAAALWNLSSGTVWVAASVAVLPVQVFVDGARMTPSLDPPPALLPGCFRYVSGEGLYLNIGGDNPGIHATFVGRRTHGFRLTGRSYVTVQGFTVTRSEDNGIYLLSGSSNDTIAGNTVTFTGNAGIAVSGGGFLSISGNTASDNANHGISLSGATADSTIQDNDAARNARGTARAANGIKLDTTARIVVQRNLLHLNQDTGLQINHSTDVVSLQNRSWDNGDHGYDHLDAHNTNHIGDLAYHNFRDGFSTEGTSQDTHLYDCISVDNGLTTNRFDEWVEGTSTAGYLSDSNILWNSTSQPPIKWNLTAYTTISAFTAATGQDAHSIQSNPLFADAANGLFRLTAGSPAIDSADSSPALWPAIDAAGNARIDDPSAPNAGMGPIAFADRGPLEFIPPCVPERCDGLDNDCDGSIDEGFDVGAPCVSGMGACATAGSKICAPGGASTICSAVPGPPAPEACDGLDNNCDGSIDNGAAPAGNLGVTVQHIQNGGALLVPVYPVRISWSFFPDALAYDLVRGGLQSLHTTGGNFSTSTGPCLAGGLSVTHYTDPDYPAPSDGFWYLVRATNACGAGTYDSGAPSQTGSRDAEIAASPNPCP